MVSPHH